MAEIKILDKSIFNRIAAGEVVDRPASIVKELIENAVDAGATHISVDISGGGMKYISVADDGSGIVRGQVKTAFCPHATSKISALTDLDGIATLGFRGEALPSIASVAKVTMLTRTADSDLGTVYTVDNGTEIDFGEMGAPYGTRVTVEDLFDRIPARKKFLAKESAEESAITNLVARYILSRYNIAFTYSAEGKVIYSSSGEGEESAIISIYGADFLEKMAKIQSTMSGIALHGYVNKPAFSKHSRSFQTLVVNGRYVVNDEISYLIFGCFQKYLMKRQYPAYVLYLDLPYDLVDVNVHPNKLEVKFAAPAMIKKIVADAVKSQVLKDVAVPKDLSDIFGAGDGVPGEGGFFSVTPADGAPSYPISETAAVPTRESAAADIFDLPLKGHFVRQKVDSASLLAGEESVRGGPIVTSGADSVPLRETAAPSFAAPKQLSYDIPERERIAGKLFNTYIIVEKGDSAYFIDQHAAHEKLLYDRLVRERERGVVASQRLLVPYEFTVSADEAEALENNRASLGEAGFEIGGGEKGRYSLKCVPACCAGLNARDFIADLLSAAGGAKAIPKALDETLMQAACKAAAKGNDDLSDLEIEALLSNMRDGMTELFCPHGRPVVIRIARHEIEKWFKRIV